MLGEVLYLLVCFAALVLGFSIVSLFRYDWKGKWHKVSLGWAIGFLLTIPLEFCFHKPLSFVWCDVFFAVACGGFSLLEFRKSKQN